MRSGEFDLIRRLTSGIKSAKGVSLGPGDDCAVVRGPRRLLLTTDLLVENVHFRRDWMTPGEIGLKAMLVNLSDVAAMGGRPLFALVSVGFPGEFGDRDAEELYRGLERAARKAKVSIVGGDTNAAERLTLNVALAGEAGPRILRRDAARPGDVIYVTGEIGAAALGLAALGKKRTKGFESFILRHKRPPLRLRVARALSRIRGVHALLDVSDGLAGDLGHILEASGTGADVDLDRLPLPRGFTEAARRLGVDPASVSAGGGEDYELLFTASPRARIPSKIGGVRVTKIGMMTAPSRGIRWLVGGEPLPRGRARGFRSFRHF